MTAGLDRAVRADHDGGAPGRILAALAQAGLAPGRLRAGDPAPSDSMHVGGRRATRDATAPRAPANLTRLIAGGVLAPVEMILIKPSRE